MTASTALPMGTAMSCTWLVECSKKQLSPFMRTSFLRTAGSMGSVLRHAKSVGFSPSDRSVCICKPTTSRAGSTARVHYDTVQSSHAFAQLLPAGWNPDVQQQGQPGLSPQRSAVLASFSAHRPRPALGPSSRE